LTTFPTADWQVQNAINSRVSLPVYGVTENPNLRSCSICSCLIHVSFQAEHNNSHMMEKYLIDRMDEVIKVVNVQQAIIEGLQTRLNQRLRREEDMEVAELIRADIGGGND
jgi:hypothetical protein